MNYAVPSRKSAGGASAHGQRAFALVLALLLLVLLTGAALVFFLRSSSYNRGGQLAAKYETTTLVARAVMNTMVSDLRAEIAAGSYTNVPVAGGNPPPYLPLLQTNTSVLPERIFSPYATPQRTGTDDALPNLVKRSAQGLPFFNILGQQGPVRASQASTDAAPLEGRAIARERWGFSRLLPTAATGDEPVTQFQVPDWIIVTRSAVGVTSAGQTISSNDLPKLRDRAPGNNDYAVARVAYLIYNEGGLLDANVAGGPAGIPAAESARKGAPAFADLSATGLSGAQVSELVEWRNKASAAGGGADFADHVRQSTNGWNRPLLVGGQSDRAFVSRQMLLRFWEEKGFPPESLQYFGTASLALDAPDFFPDPGRPKVNRPWPGLGVAQSDDLYNPPLPTVKFAADTTLPDGTLVKAGTPLVFRRFPVEALDLLGPGSTAAKDPADPIYRRFGLYRSSASDPWLYDHGNPTRILYLSEVAALNREPDFFELLQAGILHGSLGATASAPDSANGILTRAADRDFFRQVLQIGANIIDQNDSDDSPSRLAFGSAPALPVYGVENHPGFSEFSNIFHRRNNQGTANAPVIGAWIQFELWNPNQNPGTNINTYRVVIDEGSSRLKIFNNIYSPKNTGAAFSPDNDYAASPSFLEFTASGSDFRTPRVLTAPGDTRGVEVTGASPGNIVTGDPKFSWIPANRPPVNFAGIKAGELFALDDAVPDGNPANNVPTTESRQLATIQFPNSAARIKLQRNVGGAWETIQEIRGPSEDDFFYDSQLDAIRTRWWTYPDRLGVAGHNYGYDGSTLIDPRTTRFGLWGGDLVTPGGWPGTNSSGDNIYPVRWNTSGYGAGASWHGGGGPNQNSQIPHRLLRNTAANSRVFQRDPDRAVAALNAARTQTLPRPADTFRLDVEGGENPWANTPAAFEGRPVRLDRAFTGVGDFGYASRDQPWKTLDFATGHSADGGLLDLFSTGGSRVPRDETRTRAVVSGLVDLNTRQAPVLAALLGGAGRTGAEPASPLNASEATLIAGAITNITATNPLVNRAWIPQLLESPTIADRTKTAREAVSRTLAGTTQSRTWVLLVDLVCQMGSYPPGATSLDQFAVATEQRYWVHVSIDRVTGEIVSEQWELVYE